MCNVYSQELADYNRLLFNLVDDGDKHPGPTIAALMKLSFDEEHRHAMCQLGGLYAITHLIQVSKALSIKTLNTLELLY